MKTLDERIRETLKDLNGTLKDGYIEQEFIVEITTAINLIYELAGALDREDRMRKYPWRYDKDGIRKEG